MDVVLVVNGRFYIKYKIQYITYSMQIAQIAETIQKCIKSHREFCISMNTFIWTLFIMLSLAVYLVQTITWRKYRNFSSNFQKRSVIWDCLTSVTRTSCPLIWSLSPLRINVTIVSCVIASSCIKYGCQKCSELEWISLKYVGDCAL